MLRRLGIALGILVLAGCAGLQHVSFPSQDGGRFYKESWATQARALAKAGFRVAAIDLRGRGHSRR